ncbi:MULTISPECIES: DUF397 domain-containing protein [Streptomyces violaceusniger group]|uniref:DUF397 domain-containing protein n=1 Tax=Streptomyces rhizosphaericus TaxID=114699 RepID=A0ABN1SGD2_9ACTN|nr:MULTISPECIES: DUF397 domain-containing protein [Streptomyces violaceusniger group]
MSTTELDWFKSSYSGSEGDSCVEVALSWRKSSHSNDFDNACVEVAACPGTVHIRDSKDKQGPQLAVSPAAWSSFVAYAASS